VESWFNSEVPKGTFSAFGFGPANFVESTQTKAESNRDEN